MRFNSIEDIDARIRELETEMMTSSLSLSEEKKRVQAIQQLKNGKSAVAALAGERARASQLKEMIEMSREDLKTWQQELRSKMSNLNDLREQEKEIEQKIVALRESAPSMQVSSRRLLAVCRRRRRRGDSCPFQTLIDEKRKLWAEKREKQAAMKAEGDTHFEMLRAWRTYEKLKKDWDCQERRDRIAVEKKAAIVKDNSKAADIFISGVQGVHSVINGLYSPTKETGQDGRILYRRSGERGDEALCIEHFEGLWRVKNESKRGSGACRAFVEGGCALEDCRSRTWKVVDGEFFVDEPSVRMSTGEAARSQASGCSVIAREHTRASPSIL